MKNQIEQFLDSRKTSRKALAIWLVSVIAIYTLVIIGGSLLVLWIVKLIFGS